MPARETYAYAHACTARTRCVEVEVEAEWKWKREGNCSGWPQRATVEVSLVVNRRKRMKQEKRENALLLQVSFERLGILTLAINNAQLRGFPEHDSWALPNSFSAFR